MAGQMIVVNFHPAGLKRNNHIARTLGAEVVYYSFKVPVTEVVGFKGIIGIS